MVMVDELMTFSCRIRPMLGGGGRRRKCGSARWWLPTSVGQAIRLVVARVVPSVTHGAALEVMKRGALLLPHSSADAQARAALCVSVQTWCGWPYILAARTRQALRSTLRHATVPNDPALAGRPAGYTLESPNTMLRQTKDLQNLAIVGSDSATERTIGDVEDLYFDDEAWAIRYLVVDAGSWLSRRKVLISPIAAGKPD